MRYAVISDIHANLHALEAVLKDIAKNKVDAVLCGGDIIGYGAFPNECCRRVLELWSDPKTAPCVMGNHDAAAVGADISAFNTAAQSAALWTREVLEDDCRRWLEQLPLVHEADGLLLVHASAAEPEEWPYVVNGPSFLKCAEAALSNHGRRATAIGHSHVAVAVGIRFDQADARLVFSAEGSAQLTLAEDRGAVINVGSVGQPRDGDWRAGYALIACEDEAVEVTLRRVEYDVEAAKEAILHAGLPEFLALRLGDGH